MQNEFLTSIHSGGFVWEKTIDCTNGIDWKCNTKYNTLCVWTNYANFPLLSQLSQNKFTMLYLLRDETDVFSQKKTV